MNLYYKNLKGFCELLKTHLTLQEWVEKNNKKLWVWIKKKSKINIVFLIF